MIYKEKRHISATEKIIEHNVVSCIKCGHDDINIHEYEDQFGYISSATCKNCKSKIEDDVSEVGIIKAWNKANDIPTVIADKKTLIRNLQQEVKELKIKLKNKKS